MRKSVDIQPLYKSDINACQRRLVVRNIWRNGLRRRWGRVVKVLMRRGKRN
jgi:hypothetical protein